MRHILLILMIALLPVRGWSADMMGVVMATQALSATQVSHAATPVSMSADCPMWASQTGGDDPTTNHKSCASCQLCMACVAGQSLVPISAAPLPQAPQMFANISFTSAERAPGFKPPIS